MSALSGPLLGLRRMLEEPRRAVRWLIDVEHDRKFERWPGAYRGVYDSFEAARAAAPSSKLGFDHAELTNIYDNRVGKAFSSDYPVLFWLGSLLDECRSVFDWGGHIGVSYYTYRRYLTFPEGFRWHVCEVPAISKAGAELAIKNGAEQLSFTTEPREASGFDVLLAAGSLQFLEAPFAADLGQLERKPRHLLINKLPLYEGKQFITLQNTIHSYNPYKVQNRNEFVASVEGSGYELVDAWDTPDMTCRIPLHPEHSISAYSGFYFRAKP